MPSSDVEPKTDATVVKRRRRCQGWRAIQKNFESEILNILTVDIRQQACCVVDAQHMIEQQKKAQEIAMALLRKKAKKLEALQRGTYSEN